MKKALAVAAVLAAAVVASTRLVGGDAGVRPAPAQRDMALLHEFAGGGNDGANPYGSLALSGSPPSQKTLPGSGASDHRATPPPFPAPLPSLSFLRTKLLAAVGQLPLLRVPKSTA